EGGGLEGVSVILLDERLGLARRQLGDDAPVVASPLKSLIGVLDPDDGDLFAPRLLDQAANVRHDRVAIVSPPHDAVLYVDHEECCVRPVLECTHARGSSLMVVDRASGVSTLLRTLPAYRRYFAR